jgi:cytochrome c oxidase assembly factor CtaG
MPTPYESAQLNLQLFNLRREPVLREARDWFTREFNPASFAEMISIVRGPRNASFRMVLSYWNMAASLVTTGAIDGAAFCAANDEIFATFSKVHPFLAELRAAAGEPEFGKHIETVVLAAPNAEAILERRRTLLRAVAIRQKAETERQGAALEEK